MNFSRSDHRKCGLIACLEYDFLHNIQLTPAGWRVIHYPHDIWELREFYSHRHKRFYVFSWFESLCTFNSLNHIFQVFAYKIRILKFQVLI